MSATPKSVSEGKAKSWEEVAEMEADNLEDLKYDLLDHKCDETGYRDQISLNQRPADAEKELVAVETLLLVVGMQPDVRHSKFILLEAAARLRWIRDSGLDPHRWGVAMGLLRRQLQLMPYPESLELHNLLDPYSVPKGSWQQLVRQFLVENDARIRSQQALEEFAELMDHVPDANTSRSHLLDWISAASNHLSKEHMARLLEPVSTSVQQIDPKDVGRRRVRARIMKLNSIWTGNVDTVPTASQPQSVSDTHTSEMDQNHAEESQISSAATEMDRLREKVRDKVAGKRAVLVGNREDSELETRLQRELQLQVEVVVATPNRIEAISERLSSGTLDYLLYASGFGAHKDVKKLARASKAGGVHFLDVGKGRPLACLLALARDLELA